MVMGYLMTLGMNCADPNMGKLETWQDYAVTYHKPTGIQLPTPWTDNHGQSGSIDYLVLFTGKIIIIPPG